MCIQDIGLAGAGQFIAFTQGGSAHVMSYDGESLRLMWEFTDVAPCEPRSESCFAVRLGEDNKPCIGSVYWSHANRQAILQTFMPRLAEGKERDVPFHFEPTSTVQSDTHV